MKHLKRIMRKIISKICGHKNTCCENITWRCRECPLCLTEDEARRLREKHANGYFSIKERK